MAQQHNQEGDEIMSMKELLIKADRTIISPAVRLLMLVGVIYSVIDNRYDKACFYLILLKMCRPEEE